MKTITVRENGKRRVATINNQPSKTQQQFKDEVNVNNIMKKYRATGTITHLNNKEGKFADISNAQDYLESIQTITTANEAFHQLPSEIRRRFHNDPAELLEFINDPNNHDEGVKLGIFNKNLPPIIPATPLPVEEPQPEPTPAPKKSKN